ANGNSIGRISPWGSVITFTAPGIRGPTGITAGPDGAMWFTNYASIGRITVGGAVTIFGGGPTTTSSITTGPDGAAWFTGGAGIGPMTTSGVTGISLHGPGGIYYPTDIATGPDGAVWFANTGDSSNQNAYVGRIAMDGTVTNLHATDWSRPASIVAGPDGAM